MFKLQLEDIENHIDSVRKKVIEEAKENTKNVDTTKGQINTRLCHGSVYSNHHHHRLLRTILFGSVLICGWVTYGHGMRD